MKIVHDNIAVLDMGSQDLLSSWIMECGKLCHDDGVAIHYLPHITPGRVVVDAGAALGDQVTGVSFSLDQQLIDFHGYVSAADTVTVILRNNTGGAIDLASGTLRVRVIKAV